MINTKRPRVYSIIAAICFLAEGLYYTIRDISLTVTESAYTINFASVLRWLILFGYAGFLIIKMKGVGLLAVAGAEVLLRTYFSFGSLSLLTGTQMLGPWTFWGNVIDVLACVGLIIIIFLHTLPSMQKYEKFNKKLWFIPAAVFLFGHLTLEILYGTFQFAFRSSMILRTVSMLVHIAGYLFIGLWLKDEALLLENSATRETSNEAYTKFDPRSLGKISSNTVLGGADRLKSYKELLDSGTITQEEYDAKKKQILEL